jgi:hypothetical protein
MAIADVTEEVKAALGLPKEDEPVKSCEPQVWEAIIDKIFEGVEDPRLIEKREHFKGCPTCKRIDECGALKRSPNVYALALGLKEEVDDIKALLKERAEQKARKDGVKVDSETPPEERDADFDVKIEAVRVAMKALEGEGVAYMFVGAKKGVSYHSAGVYANHFDFEDLVEFMLGHFAEITELGPAFAMQMLAKLMSPEG